LRFPALWPTIANVDAEPILDREEALAAVWALMDIITKLEQIRRLLGGEEEKEEF
jgi:hypothetical protein